MSLVNHAGDDCRPGSGSIVNGSLSKVVSSDEESSLHIKLLELVKHVVGVDIRSIIISNGNRSGYLARIDSLATVGNGAELGTREVASVVSIGNSICIAAVAKIKQTILVPYISKDNRI